MNYAIKLPFSIQISGLRSALSIAKAYRVGTGIVLGILLSSCASSNFDPNELIIGAWRSSVADFPVNVEYTDSRAKLAGYKAVPYKIENNVLTLEGDEPGHTIIFDSKDVMRLIDIRTGTEQVYQRTR